MSATVRPAVTALAEQFLGGRQQALCRRPLIGCHAGSLSASGQGAGTAAARRLRLGSGVGGDRAGRGRVRDEDWSLLREDTVADDTDIGAGDTVVVGHGVSIRGDRGTLREPAVDRRHQVGPGRVPARLEHRLHERVGGGHAVEHVAVERRLRVVLVVDLLEQRDPAVAGVAERRRVAVGDDPVGERVPVDGRAALLRERLEQPGQRDRVGADVADRERRAEAELEAVQLQQRGERGDGERDDDLGAGRAQRRDLRAPR